VREFSMSLRAGRSRALSVSALGALARPLAVAPHSDWCYRDAQEVRATSDATLNRALNAYTSHEHAANRIDIDHLMPLHHRYLSTARLRFN